ncbi:MAG: VCBS repeat-containing protein, partial [Acidobacteria bacterium]|nr:VCBS repeat-containing protein [Acidobacteriota bacterium]
MRLILWLLLPAALMGGEHPWARHAIDSSSRGADGVRLADVNGDGLLDIATGWEEGGRVRAYLNPGAGKAKQPWPSVTVGEVGSPEDAVFVDLDGDGAWDVVSSTEGKQRTLFVHWAPPEPGRYLDPDAWRTEAIPASVELGMWMFVTPADIDGRNGPDLFAGSKNEQAKIGWWEAPEDARELNAWIWHPLYDAGWIMSLIEHDMDGDGDPDLVATDRKGPNSGILWIENPSRRVHRIGTVGEEELMFMKMADLDGDGESEAVAATLSGPIVRYRREGDGWRRYEVARPPEVTRGKAV